MPRWTDNGTGYKQATVVIRYRLTPAQWYDICLLAKREGTSPAAWVRYQADMLLDAEIQDRMNELFAEERRNRADAEILERIQGGG